MEREIGVNKKIQNVYGYVLLTEFHNFLAFLQK